MGIVIDTLTKKYGEQVAVNGISLQIDKAGVVGFLGPNGAGKSTTMKMLTGYLTPDAGSIRVCGTNVLAEPLAAKRHIGYLPESNALYYDMYVREYLSFTAALYLPGETGKQRAARVETALEQVGLRPEAHKKTGQLSKGYKQRVGIAAALLHNPDVLILDEPTSGLDPNQLVEIRALIKTLGQSKTVLLSTHIMQEAEAMCERVIIIHKGNIAADDTLANLQKSGQQARQLRVGFEEPLEPEWLRRLAAVASVEKVDALQWILHTHDTDAARRQVLQLAAGHNLNISSLQVAGGSLEEIFKQATKSS